MQQTAIPFKKTRVATNAALFLGLTGGAMAVLWAMPPAFDTVLDFLITLIVHGIGWAAVLFFGALVLVCLIKLLDRRPGLVLNERGLLPRRSTIAGAIPWPHIAGFEIAALKRQKLLIVKLIEPEWYIANAPHSKRWILQANLKRYGSPAVVMTGTLAMSAEALAALCEDYLARHQRGE